MNNIIVEIQKMKQGNFNDYQNFYALTGNYIYKLIFDVLKEETAAGYVLNETYNHIYREINNLQDENQFFVWSGAIATNQTLLYLKNQNQIKQIPEGDIEGFVFQTVLEDQEPFIPENLMVNDEYSRIVDNIIQNLSSEAKIMVQFFYMEGFSVKDIANRMDCSENAVRTTLNSFRKQIKNVVMSYNQNQGEKLQSMVAIPIVWYAFWNVLGNHSLGMMTVGAIGTVAAKSMGAAYAGVATNMAGNMAAGAGNAAGSMAGNVAAGAMSTGAGAASSAGVAAGVGMSVGAKVAITAAIVAVVGGGTLGAIHIINEKNDKKEETEITENVTTEEFIEIQSSSEEEIQQVTEETTEEITEATTEEIVYGDDLVTDGNAVVIMDNRTYKVPYINWDSDVVDVMNEEINALCTPYIEGAWEDYNGSGYIYNCGDINYSWYMNEDILTVQIFIFVYPDASGWTDTYIYTVDLRNDVRMEKPEIINYFGLSEDEYNQKIQESLGNEYITSYSGLDESMKDDFYYSQYERTVALENAQAAVPYIGEDGELYVVADIYSLAGGDKYPHHVKIE